MTIWYLNSRNEPEKSVCDNPETEKMDRGTLGRLVMMEGIWTINKHRKTIWIPPSRILKIEL